MLPAELWEPNYKSSSLPVDRKYQKGQSRDNYTILLFNSKYKCQWKNVIFLQVYWWRKLGVPGENH
jgi:hypothetical protein